MIPAAFIIARITDTQGSTPRENGAYMLIGAQESLGSIGGGKLEQQVIVEARTLLASEHTPHPNLPPQGALPLS